MNRTASNHLRLLFLGFYLLVCGIAFAQKASKELKDFVDKPFVKTAQVGICVYDANTDKYIQQYQSDKYFIPASNTKLFSLYAGLKYIGDSLIGIRYLERDSAILLLPAGDPTLLHPDYSRQPVIDFLKSKKKPIYVTSPNWQEQALGRGWSWDDYNDEYMVERSPLPVYGNIIKWEQAQQSDGSFNSFSSPEVNWKVNFNSDSSSKKFFVKRDWCANIFQITQGTEKTAEQDVPFVTNGLGSAIELLKDTVGKNIFILPTQSIIPNSKFTVLRSQPVDSIFRPMMFRSDNFFAEQTLLMASNERLGLMNDQEMIDTLLNTDLKDLPQKPVWVDGSGLSHYNLFSPEDFIFLLKKLKYEFGLERMKRILPTGGQGTLGNRYKQDSGYVFAKTGSLSGVITFSGYLITKKNHLLLFSILVNNNNGGEREIRDAIQQYIGELRARF